MYFIGNDDRMQYLTIREEEGSVVSITVKERQSFGNKSLILVQANGFKMEDTDTTRGKFYRRIWHIEMSVFSPVLSIILSIFLVARNRLYIWPSITRTLKWDKAIDRTKNKNVSKQQRIELSNMNFCRFFSFRKRWQSSTYRLS